MIPKPPFFTEKRRQCHSSTRPFAAIIWTPPPFPGFLRLLSRPPTDSSFQYLFFANHTHMHKPQLPVVLYFLSAHAVKFFFKIQAYGVSSSSYLSLFSWRCFYDNALTLYLTSGYAEKSRYKTNNGFSSCFAISKN